MSVRCEGDSHVMEQLGEKQDFESELSRLGFAHEDFMLDVRRVRPGGSAARWDVAYTVCVTHTPTRRRNIYWGGADRRWLPEFVTDLHSGFYGAPRFVESARSSAPSASSPFLTRSNPR